MWDAAFLTTLTHVHSTLKLSHTWKMTLAPTPTTLVGEVTLTLGGKDKVSHIKDDRVVKVIHYNKSGYSRWIKTLEKALNTSETDFSMQKATLGRKLGEMCWKTYFQCAINTTLGVHVSRCLYFWHHQDVEKIRSLTWSRRNVENFFQRFLKCVVSGSWFPTSLVH